MSGDEWKCKTVNADDRDRVYELCKLHIAEHGLPKNEIEAQDLIRNAIDFLRVLDPMFAYESYSGPVSKAPADPTRSR